LPGCPRERDHVADILHARGGLAIASLLRPPAADERDRADLWVRRAREAAAWGPVGHHTHFAAARTARPTADSPPPASVVRAEAEWLASEGIVATCFCGGGWYIDADVATEVARLGYVDCSATRFRHGYLAAGAPRAALDAPALVQIGGDRLRVVPSTHSLGLFWRDAVRRRLPPFVHLYFHDFDLLDARRRAALEAAMRLLGRLRPAADVVGLARPLPVRDWEEVAA
jgi:hypothetical protein